MITIKRRATPPSTHPLLSDSGSTTLHPLLQHIYAARGVEDPREVNYVLANLLSHAALSDIDNAVACLYQALLAQQRILIIGDFDVDGATSTALAILALRAFGFTNVEYLIPNRFEYGYGLTPEIVNFAVARQIEPPQLIITVDNGISSYAGVLAAKELGIKVIITDHHLPQTQAGVDATSLPLADAIINPNKNGDNFASKNLAGVGVIFYLMLALRAFLRAQNWFKERNITEPNMGQFLDLVALGTLADLVPLDYNNRILVHHGLAHIRAGKCRLGIKVLLNIANRSYERVKGDDLIYVVAPRLNAAGRLDDMTVGVACLLSDSFPHVRALTRELEALNQERRKIEADMQQQALQELGKIKFKEDELPSALCIFDEGWHQGVVGLLASKLTKRFYRPTIAFAAMNEEELKGSGRSIAGINIADILITIAARYPHLIVKFGGHAMAAGLTVRRENYAQFANVFVATVASAKKALDEAQFALAKNSVSAATANNAENQDATDIFEQVIYSDGELAEQYLSLETAELLQRASPWGSNFPEPLFDGKFELVTQRIVGAKHLKLTLRVPESEQQIDAIHFNFTAGEWPNHRATKVHALYRLDVNEYNGRRSLQFLVEQLTAC